MQYYKKFTLGTAIVFTAGLLLSSCGGGDNTAKEETHKEATKEAPKTAEKKILKVWAFSKELETNGTVAEFEKRHPDYKVKLSVFATEDYLTKLKPALRRDSTAPDVFLSEVSQVKALINTKYWMNLDNEITEEQKADYVPYVLDMGKDDKGHLKAISWQATPGGFFYRRSYAKKYLGTDDPVKVAQAINSWKKLQSFARTLKKKSHGKVKLIGSGLDFFYPSKASRTHGYIENNKFVLDKVFVDWMKRYKTFYQQNLSVRGKLWGPAWRNGMKEGVFGYYLPTWGLYFVLKGNAPETSGDWAVTNPTEPFYWGGTWLGVYYHSSHKQAALDFIKMQATDHQYMEDWVKRTGDFSSSKYIQEKMKDATYEFLGGQKHYEYFTKAAQLIPTEKYMTKHDLAIDGIIEEEGTQYAKGKQNLRKTIKNINARVKSAFQLD